MSSLQHGAAVKTTCVTCRVTGEDNITGEIVGDRSLKEPMIEKDCGLKTTRSIIKSFKDVCRVGQVRTDSVVEIY